MSDLELELRVLVSHRVMWVLEMEPVPWKIRAAISPAASHHLPAVHTHTFPYLGKFSKTKVLHVEVNLNFAFPQLYLFSPLKMPILGSKKQSGKKKQ